MKSLLQNAIMQLGVKEITGPEHNPTIVNYAKEAGFNWVNDDETPWCSIFLNWVTKKSDLPGTNKSSARSWLLVGEKVTDPMPGDIVIFWRESIESWKGHVGIFMGFDETVTRVYTLGGNQGNMVSITAYDNKCVLGFRRLYPHGVTNIPDKELKRGDVNEDVRQLQLALTRAGFECGLADGYFGPKTELAVKKLQSTDRDIPVSGKFDKKTRSLLMQALQS